MLCETKYQCANTVTIFATLSQIKDNIVTIFANTVTIFASIVTNKRQCVRHVTFSWLSVNERHFRYLYIIARSYVIFMFILSWWLCHIWCTSGERCACAAQTRKKLLAWKQCLQTFLVKIAEFFYQNNASTYIGVSSVYFTMWDNEKEPTGIESIRPSAK